jgi:hypothetical protein
MGFYKYPFNNKYLAGIAYERRKIRLHIGSMFNSQLPYAADSALAGAANSYDAASHAKGLRRGRKKGCWPGGRRLLRPDERGLPTRPGARWRKSVAHLEREPGALSPSILGRAVLGVSRSARGEPRSVAGECLRNIYTSPAVIGTSCPFPKRALASPSVIK